MKKIVFLIAISIIFLQCSKNEPVVSNPNKNIPYLDFMQFFDIESAFDVNLSGENVGNLTFTLYSYDMTNGEMTKIKDLGVKPASFVITKEEFGTLKVDTSVFVLRAEAEGIMRESYIEYKSIFPKALTYGKSYKGIEGKTIEDTVTITLNKNIEGLTWTVGRKVNTSGSFAPVTLNDVNNKPHIKTIHYTLSEINNTNLVGGKDTIIYELSVHSGGNFLVKEYKEPVKVDALAKNIATTLTYKNNAFSQRLPFSNNGITLTKTDSVQTLFSILEGKSYKYLSLLNLNYVDSLQFFHLYKESGSGELKIATIGDKSPNENRVTFVPANETVFKTGSRVEAEKIYSDGAKDTSISVNAPGTQHHAVKLLNKEVVKSKKDPKVDSIADVTYYGFLEVVKKSLTPAGDVGEVLLTLKCSPKRDYTKE